MLCHLKNWHKSLVERVRYFAHQAGKYASIKFQILRKRFVALAALVIGQLAQLRIDYAVLVSSFV